MNKNGLMIIFGLTLLILGLSITNFIRLYPIPVIGEEGPYELFIHQLIHHGRLDFSQAGFQGASLFALPLAMLGLKHSFVLINVIAGAFLPLLTYLITKKLYPNQNYGLMTALIAALMPWQMFSGFNGFTNSFYYASTLLTIYFVIAEKRYAWILLTISFLTKPLSIVLLPLFLANKSQIKQYFGSVLLLVLYLLIELLVSGTIIFGVHNGITVTNFFSIKRVFYNLASAPPLLFSLHNFLAFSPEKTTYTDMLGTTPLIILAAIAAVFYLPKSLRSRYHFHLITTWVLAFLICLFWNHLAAIYLDTFVFISLFLAIPLLTKYKIFYWLTILTASYQYVYYYLQDRVGSFFIWGPLALALFAIPFIVLISSVMTAHQSTAN